MAFDGQQYKNGSDASIATSPTNGGQFQTFYWIKQSLIELVKESYFQQLADVTAMPKHFGKKIKRYHYLPLLDDRNLNDQGIDAAGVTITGTQYYVTLPALEVEIADANAATLVTRLNDNIDNAGVARVVASAGAAGSGWTAGKTKVTVTQTTIKFATLAKAQLVTALNVGASLQQGSGNLYGSSKDIGTISGKLPALSETGGRVNRVGFKRIEIEGSMEKFGFFDEWSEESLDFDTDAELEQHINREMLRGANEMTEDALQIDLLTQAGTVRFPGTALSPRQITKDHTVTYGTLMRAAIELDNNRTPKSITAITGSRMVDTKTIMGARVLYCGSEMIPTLKALKDLHNNEAFIPVHKYQAGGSTVQGEIGSIDQWRIVIVPEMMKWAGAGADIAGDTTCYSTNGKFDVFPMLCVGEGSFTTISFKTDGKDTKFRIFTKKPGEATADRNDPYGETGFMSIKWWYGFMLLRGERLLVIKTAALI